MTAQVCQAPVTNRTGLSELPGLLCDLQGSFVDAAGLIYFINRYYDSTTDEFPRVDPRTHLLEVTVGIVWACSRSRVHGSCCFQRRRMFAHGVQHPRKRFSQDAFDDVRESG